MNGTTDTYAKVFQSMYTGSLYGAGLHVFAVWGWVLAHKDETGYVEVNPVLVAHELGGTAEQVQQAIDFLCAPDPKSRSKEAEGRRLEKIDDELVYKVVNHAKYRERGKDRREYWKNWRAEHKTDRVAQQ
ncbi:MAG: hypothetical protein WC655_13960 [Candidatus Hydrogenedentales bacterium]|jgi:hypothetical protein